MKTKSRATIPWAKWPKNEVRPCPTGKCKHLHVKGTGPCTESGCGCHGSYGTKQGKRHG